MPLRRYKSLILIVCLAAALLVASPALQQLVSLPKTDDLTEFWLLGPNHNGVYPSNVTADQNYRLYLGTSNHLGSCAYYVVEIKFANQTQSSPDSFNHTSSTQPALSSLTYFVAQNESYEVPLDISLQYQANDKNPALVDMKGVTVNGEELSLNTTSVAFDISKGGFFGNLIFELYLYNQTTNNMEYNQRYLNLWLKLMVE